MLGEYCVGERKGEKREEVRLMGCRVVVLQRGSALKKCKQAYPQDRHRVGRLVFAFGFVYVFVFVFKQTYPQDRHQSRRILGISTDWEDL